ncbi:DUF2007 domain-containing protein [Kineothrix sp. MSJ-39]|uniref:DUF2007 domain-containing protein n=1 Tax=Kineothrix sp. MSJ-39 TaxID=2841533 RepID=UPI001C123AC6|nr:DUF2007 domain-containing protein [Kineothrix sp. MSJ-39]MBU5429880.1 DUF2007 domain-containing protein [Kineothrix sp. MSJ-39]
MITIWNRKLLFDTYDMGKQGTLRQLLAQNNIEYTYKLAGNAIGSQGKFGSSPQRPLQYKIYVHKKDYDAAKKIMHDQKIF